MQLLEDVLHEGIVFSFRFVRPGNPFQKTNIILKHSRYRDVGMADILLSVSQVGRGRG